MNTISTTPPRETSPSGYEPPALLIAGEFIDTRHDCEPVIAPANGATLAMLPHATPADLDDALRAAQHSFGPWRELAPQSRGRILKQAADLLRGQAGAIARLVAREVGKPLAEGLWEALLAADTLEWFAEEGRRAYGRVLPGRQGKARFMVVKEPVGPVAAFAPWNFPVVNAARKIGSALAAGCPCIFKPAEEAPASALAVGRALVDAGLPPGVLSIVFGVPAEVSAHLLASRVIRKVSFTGSIPVGRHLMKLAAEGGQRTTMELGGHASVIVCEDANLEAVLDQATVAKFRNAGQVCVSPTRFYVHRRLYDRFVEGFAARAQALRVGDGLDERSQMGPLIHERRRAGVAALVDDAVRAGGHLAAGGHYIDGPGFFYRPTVLAGVPESARIMNEEPFGPVAIVNPFDDLDGALASANRLSYGLAAYGFTDSAANITRLGDALEAGMVGLNSFSISIPDTPFLGVKDSGHGAENGVEGLEACLVTKVISLS